MFSVLQLNHLCVTPGLTLSHAAGFQREQAVKRLETAIDDGSAGNVNEALETVDITELEDESTAFVLRAGKRGKHEDENTAFVLRAGKRGKLEDDSTAFVLRAGKRGELEDENTAFVLRAGKRGELQDDRTAFVL